jgi:hypothetical protein
MLPAAAAAAAAAAAPAAPVVHGDSTWCPCNIPTDAACLLLQWQVYSPEGQFPCVADGATYAATIERMAGPAAAAQWRALEAAMAPLQRGAATFPAAALRSDPGVLLTAARCFGPQLLLTGLVANQLTVSWWGQHCTAAAGMPVAAGSCVSVAPSAR